MTLTTQLASEEAVALPCYKKPGLWQDSNSKSARQRAAQKCRALCEQIAWCERERVVTVQLYGQATGVWAGRVFTERDYRESPAA